MTRTAARPLVLTAGVLYDGSGRRRENATVVVDDGRIIESAAKPAGAPPAIRVAAIVPGFVDAHVHLLRSARNLAAVDCSPPAVRSIAGLLRAVADGAARLKRDAWVNGGDYHEQDLAERRHPTSDELDGAGGGRPVRLLHRSGHAAVVSPEALRLAGIGPGSGRPDPPGGRIERDSTGTPTGLLLGTAVRLVRPPRPSAAQLASDVRELSRRWLAQGITAVCDAGPQNDGATLELMATLVGDGVFRQRVVLMRGATDAVTDGKPSALWRIPDGVAGRLSAGHVKFMPSAASIRGEAEARQLAASIRTVATSGAACAVHVADLETLAVVLDVLDEVGPARDPGPPHRIEHLTQLPDALLPRLARTGAAVVMHPLFVSRHGDRYLREPDENPPAWLHRCATLLAAGIRVAAASDSPVVPSHPLASMAAAMTRATASGTLIGPGERVDFGTALALHTASAAALCGRPDLGTLVPGSPADLVILDEDPGALPAADLAALPARATLVAGELVAGSLG